MTRVLYFMATVARKSKTKTIKRLIGMFRAPLIFASAVMFCTSFTTYNEYHQSSNSDDYKMIVEDYVTCYFVNYDADDIPAICGKLMDIYPYINDLILALAIIMCLQFFIILIISNEEVAKHWFVMSGLAWLFQVTVTFKGQTLYSASSRKTSSVRPKLSQMESTLSSAYENEDKEVLREISEIANKGKTEV